MSRTAVGVVVRGGQDKKESPHDSKQMILMHWSRI